MTSAPAVEQAEEERGGHPERGEAVSLGLN